MHSRNIILGLASAAALFALAGPGARADVAVDGTPPGTPISIVNNGNGTYTWTYNVVLTQTETLKAGNFFTFYDFAGFTGAFSAPAGYTESSALLGPSPLVADNGTGIPVDNATLPNVTFTYTGATNLVGPQPLGAFSLTTTLQGPAEIARAFGAEAFESSGPSNENITNYFAPNGPSAVPEPGELAFAATFGTGLLGLLGRARFAMRRRSLAA